MNWMKRLFRAMMWPFRTGKWYLDLSGNILVASLLFYMYYGFAFLLLGHVAKRGQLTIYSNEIQSYHQMASCLDSATMLLNTEGIKLDHEVDVLFARSSQEYTLLTDLFASKTIALTRPLFSRVILRPCDWKHGVVLVPDSSDITYVLVHELCHQYYFDRASLWDFWVHTPTWKFEGYSEYIAHRASSHKSKGEDYKSTSIAQREELSQQYDAKSSGSYHRYRLYVKFLLETKGLSFDELLSYDDMAPEMIDKEVRSLIRSGQLDPRD